MNMTIQVLLDTIKDRAAVEIRSAANYIVLDPECCENIMLWLRHDGILVLEFSEMDGMKHIYHVGDLADLDLMREE